MKAKHVIIDEVIFLNINVKQVLLFILGIIILFFLANLFIYIIFFALICWFIYTLYKFLKPYINGITKKYKKPKTKNGKIIIEAKYKEK